MLFPHIAFPFNILLLANVCTCYFYERQGSKMLQFDIYLVVVRCSYNELHMIYSAAKLLHINGTYLSCLSWVICEQASKGNTSLPFLNAQTETMAMEPILHRTHDHGS